MKNYFFVIPIFKDTITGGTKYDLKIVSELRKQFFNIKVIAYDANDQNYKYKFFRKLLNIPNNSIICIDGLLAPLIRNIITVLNKKYKIVMLIHHPTSQENSNNHMQLINNYFSERISYNHCDKLVVVSNHIAKQIKKFITCYKKTYIVNPGIDNVFLKSELKKNKNNIITIGNIIQRKGYHILIEALSKVDGNWKLFIVGSYNPTDKYYMNLKQKIEIYNLKDKILFLGTIEQKILLSYMSKSKIFVSPTYYEGFGIALLESALFGLKIITSDIPVLKDTLKNQNVDYIKVGDINEFAKRISKSLKEKINKNNFSLSRDYTWKNSAKKFLYAITK
ncbi:MAG: hypothetical protein CMD65_02020 [Gammaproteobacteria bacterium]|nr:hypothetical protein [Gammaproteobacteria bacterium]